MLDTAKLHTYKYSDDIFKKVTVLPDGKNHGLLFLLDWSGSMSSEILATVKQLLNLTAFCKKVQIPFEVYAFTNEFYAVRRAKQGKDDYILMMNILLTMVVKKKDLPTQRYVSPDELCVLSF